MKRYSSLILSIIFILSVIVLIGERDANATTVDELEARLEALRQQDQALQEKVQGFRSLVNEAKGEVEGIKRDIRSTNYEINGLEAEIDQTQNEITLVSLQIEKFELEIEKAENQMNTTRSETGGILSELYRSNQLSQIELVFSGSNFDDFWNQHQYFSSFQTSLNNLLTQMEALKSDLEDKINEQQHKREYLTDLEQQTRIQQAVLSDKRSHQQVLLAQGETEKDQYQANLSETEGQRRNIISAILKIEEEVKSLKNFEFYLKSGKIPPPGTKIFVWPTRNGSLTQGYGGTKFARSGVAGYRFHNGIDIGGGVGTPIYAAAPGTIVGANTSACPNQGHLRNFGCQGGWGNWVAIKHSNDLVTLYAHMANPSSLRVGAEVRAGQTIGFIGSSGNVTGPHLHFSLYIEFFLVPKGYPGYNPEGTLNPLLYL